MVTPFETYPFSPTGTPLGFALTMPNRITRSEFNVKDFGAVGDGLTDDTHAIQLTFDAAFGSYTNPIGHAPDTYRSVFFPAGEYKILSMLTLRGMASGYIHGAGRDSTRLVYKGPIAASDGETSRSPRTILLRTNGLAYALFEDMSFEMTGAGLTVATNGRGPEAFANRRTDATVCFDWNWDDSNPTNTTTDVWMNCKFKGATYGFTVGTEYYEVPLGTSSTTVTIGPVATCATSLTMTPSTSFSIATQAGKSNFFPVGAIIEVSGPAKALMRGPVVSYNNSTGALILNVSTDPQSAMSYFSGETFSPPWYIWECRKTFITQPGLEANFTVAGHITPMTVPPSDPHTSCFDRPRVVSYNNSTGQLIFNTSATNSSNGNYFGTTQFDLQNYTTATPQSITSSNWAFRHYWGYECDASSWFNCVFEDCYQGIVHGNQNVINSQMLGGRFTNCAGNGWYGNGGVCQTLIGISFENNGGKGLIGTPGDDGGETYPGNYTDYFTNQAPAVVLVGCHSTSKHFAAPGRGGLTMIGCKNDNGIGGASGLFFRAGGYGAPSQIEGCYSRNGVFAGFFGFTDPAISISDSIFPYDWSNGPQQVHELVTAAPLHFVDLPGSGWLPQGLVVSINDATVNGWSDPVTMGGGVLSVSMQWNGTAWTVIGK